MKKTGAVSRGVIQTIIHERQENICIDSAGVLYVGIKLRLLFNSQVAWYMEAL
jgi:hypothetical protein